MQSSFTAGPRTFGDIVSDAIRLCRGNIPFLFKTLLAVSLIELAGEMVSLCGWYIVPRQSRKLVGMSWSVLLSLICIMLGMTISAIGQYLLTLRQLAIFRFWAGYAETYNEAYKFVWTKKFQILAIAGITHVVFIGAAIFWIIEIATSIAFVHKTIFSILGVIGVAVGIPAACLSLAACLFPLTLIAPALAIEHRPFGSVVSSRLKFVQSNFIRAACFVIFVLSSLWLMSIVLNLPPSVLNGLDMLHNWMEFHDINKQTNVYIQYLVSIWGATANMLISPMAFLSFGLFYLDGRNRVDGLDIIRRLELIEKPINKDFQN